MSSDIRVTSDLRAGWRLALGTLTILPVGDIGPITRPVARTAMLLAPVAALPLALVVWAWLRLGDFLDLPPLLTGMGAVGLLAGLTRCMHIDGLADTADGFGAGWSRERALDIMKRGDVGPMGACALIVVLGAQAVGFGQLMTSPEVAAALVIVARTACVILAAVCWRPARDTGLGAPMIGSVPNHVAAATAVVWGGVLVSVTAWSPSDLVHDAAVGAGLAALLMAVVVIWLGHRATRILGGLTGDVLGAGVELSLGAGLTVLSAGVWR